jgi:hypothetical protein
VTLAVTGNSISGRVFWHCRMTVHQRHRVPLIGSRRVIRLVSYTKKTPTFCALSVFSVAVTEKCCYAYGDGNKYFQSSFVAFQADGVSLASNVVDRKTMGYKVGEQW